MSFRDDNEALRARAEALERENQALQDKLDAVARARERRDAEPDSAEDAAVARRSDTASAVALVAMILGALGAAGAIFWTLSTRGENPLPIALALACLMALVLAVTLRNVLVVARPGEALIISGRPAKRADGSVCSYRVVLGGRVIRIPVLEHVDRLSLEPMRVEVRISGAYSKGNLPMDVAGHAYVRVCPTRPLLDNAIERFLGRDRQELARVAADTLEGATRGVIAAMTPEESRDPERLREALLLEVTHDLERLGLEIDTLSLSASLS